MFYKMADSKQPLGLLKIKLFITPNGNGGKYDRLYHTLLFSGFSVFTEQKSFNGHQMQVNGYKILTNMYNNTVDELIKKY